MQPLDGLHRLLTCLVVGKVLQERPRPLAQFADLCGGVAPVDPPERPSLDGSVSWSSDHANLHRHSFARHFRSLAELAHN